MSSEAFRPLDRDGLSQYGDRPALVSRSATLSYQELLLRAEGVVSALRSLSVREGEGVGLVSSGRGFDEAIALCGILLSGAVVIPLDASAPSARHYAILRERGVRVVVSDEAAEKIRNGLDREASAEGEPPFSTLCLNAMGALSQCNASTRMGLSAHCDPSLACILHTSGSTGKPKPVPITREGLITFADWMAELVSLSKEDRVLRVAELVFDLSWFDHVATFRNGAALCTMSRRDLMSGRSLKDAMAAHKPSLVYGVPSMLIKLSASLAEGEALSPCPRVFLFAGEVFPPRELFTFSTRLPPETRLFNLYGPTETNVCTFHEVDRKSLDAEAETPIGKSCPYAHCEIVGEANPQAIVEGPGIGELVVSGKTTLGGGPYRTGDRVLRKDDGLFYFRGRIDRMIKIRGYRVEPLEVEGTLASHPAVSRAAVLPYEDARLGLCLRAFVVLRQEQNEIADRARALKVFLAERLPPYMVPERITTLAELPITTTGKIDYRALNDL